MSRSGLGRYGLKSAEGPLCEGIEPLIQAIDAIQDGGHIWVLLWGGANVLAQALLNIKKSRSEDELANLPQNFESMQYRTKMIPAPGFGFIFQRFSSLHLLMGVRFFTSLTFSNLSWTFCTLTDCRFSFFSSAISEIRCTGNSNFSRECIGPRCIDRNVRRVLLQFQSVWSRYKPRDEGVDSKVHSDWTLWSCVGSAILKFTFINLYFGKC